MKTLKRITNLILITIVLTSCTNDDIPKQVIETEVITDVTLTFIAEDETESSYTYTDPKYRTDTYEDPIIILNSEETYEVVTHFYNKSNPEEVEDITEEVIEDKDEHFVEYRFFNVDINLTRTDQEESIDSNGIQIGVFTEWEVGEPSQGSVQQTLIHEPETKDTTNPNGDHTGGETDVEVVFDLIVE